MLAHPRRHGSGCEHGGERGTGALVDHATGEPGWPGQGACSQPDTPCPTPPPLPCRSLAGCPSTPAAAASSPPSHSTWTAGAAGVPGCLYVCGLCWPCMPAHTALTAGRIASISGAAPLRARPAPQPPVRAVPRLARELCVPAAILHGGCPAAYPGQAGEGPR